MTACSLGAQPTAVLTQTFISKKLKQAGYATHMIGKWHVGYATWDMIPAGEPPRYRCHLGCILLKMTAISLLTGRGFDTSLHYYAGAIDHFSSCQCVDGGCSAPNNAFSNQPNRSAGNHCFQNIAANQTPVRDCRFSGEVCGDGPEGDGPATLVRMEGQGKLPRYRWKSSGLHSSQDVSLLTGVTDMWCTNVTRTNISLRTLGVPSGPDDQPRGTFVRAGAVLRSEQQRHLERPALHGGGHPPHRSQRPNRPLLHVCETYPRPTFLSILPPFTFPTFRSRDVKCVREQVPGAAAEPRAAASGAALHGDVPGIAVLGPTHHERYVHLL